MWSICDCSGALRNCLHICMFRGDWVDWEIEATLEVTSWPKFVIILGAFFPFLFKNRVLWVWSYFLYLIFYKDFKVYFKVLFLNLKNIKNNFIAILIFNKWSDFESLFFNSFSLISTRSLFYWSSHSELIEISSSLFYLWISAFPCISLALYFLSSFNSSRCPLIFKILFLKSFSKVFFSGRYSVRVLFCTRLIF